MFHVACALERMLLNNGLTYEDSNIKFDKKILNALMEAKTIFKSALSINLTDDEIYYMVDIVNQH